MTTINILSETFKPATATVEQVGDWYANKINGTVEVQYGRDTITAFADRTDLGSIYVYGFVGRYRTSSKPWRAVVSRQANRDYTIAQFGRDDRAGRFHKQQGITFEPSVFFAL